METLIEHIIADFHERKLPRLTSREISLPQLPGKIDTIIGMRRTGKTYFLYQIMQDKYQQGLAKEQSLYLSGIGLQDFFAEFTRNFNVLIEKNRRNTTCISRFFD